MSEEKKSEKEVTDAQTEELNEEQLESVAGGVLIGLNVGSIAHKEIPAGLTDGLEIKIAPAAVVDTTFKFKK